MVIFHLSLSNIHRHATASSYERGEQLYQAGAVISLSQRGISLQALVEGSNVRPYQINATIDTGGITQIHCNCAYNLEGWCKHIVAMLLTCHHHPEQIEQRPSLPELVADLNLTEMHQLLQTLVQNNPNLLDNIDLAVNTLKTPFAPATTGKTTRRTTIDPAPFRREVQRLLRNAVDAWESGYDDDPVTYELQDVIRKAQAFSQQGDGNSAIVILEAITQVCAEDWHLVDDYGIDSNETVTFLDQAWAEAILTAELTPEQQHWRSALEAWQNQLDGEFVMSLTAIQQGWDAPLLLEVLQGTITEKGIWSGEVPEFADDLAQIRLQILQQQERYEEYLHLAEAEGQTEQYLTMLTRLGRVADAMGIAKTDMSTMAEAFAFAKTLREQGTIAEALEIAQQGLTLPNPSPAPPLQYSNLNLNYDFAIWTSDLAEGLADTKTALEARTIAFKAQPNLDDYLKAAELAGKDWSPLRKQLLQMLRNRSGWGSETAKVDIFLHEGLIDSAITTVTDLSYYAAPLVHRVMDAAMVTHPDWVISNACKRAEEIMDQGRSKAYHHAADWLRKAHDAYYQAGRQAEWRTYHQQIMATHSRKRSLIALIGHPDLR